MACVSVRDWVEVGVPEVKDGCCGKETAGEISVVIASKANGIRGEDVKYMVRQP